MGSGLSDPGPGGPLAAFKILIAGGFGVGKTTLVSAISEVRPLRTEEALTSVGAATTTCRAWKTRPRPPSPWTSAASPSGAAGCSTSSARPARSASGSCGTTSPPGHSAPWCWPTPAGWPTVSPSIDYFEKRRLAFVVAVNCFDGAHRYDPAEVQAALDLGPQVPVVLCDARQAESVKNVLITLVEHVLDEHARRGLRDPGGSRGPAPGVGVAGPQ